ncbi:AAA family ATPase [Pseudomonas fluorescens]|uniref:ATP-binding protein n=2 Tax=Pseudomonas TaxID=286 RepID=A0A7Z6QMS1_PSEFL|nr:AAA family ATPase [Pseudomonas fluorescens]RDS89089.1 ATP-binding protein [Pseudomonas fluorescens]
MFTVLEVGQQLPQHGTNCAYLVVDNWDDWFKFRTMFTLFVFDMRSTRHRVGSVKIGQAGLLPSSGGADAPAGSRTPGLPGAFVQLDEHQFFSLGQDEDYYSALLALPNGQGITILRSLCDCAFNLEILDRHLPELVMSESILRSIHEANVRNRLNRLANGNPELTRFEFQYTFPPAPAEPDGLPPLPPAVMQFQVIPDVVPPTNLHVLVGRNGVGKTRCIQSIINTLLDRDTSGAPKGMLHRLGENHDQWTFSGLVSVSFSAFDSFELPAIGQQRTPATFVGLRTQKKDDQGNVFDVLKSAVDLAEDFVTSLERCQTEPRRTRWLTAVATLSTDPLFGETGVEQLIEGGFEWTERAMRFFGKLSSGHAIVLLTTTRLVELVDEKTLVVLDEPEGHLHPPLLAAFIRTVADLLVSRNGVALLSTHSPVVLQEVPRSCVWMLRRTRTQSAVERPSIETFGESAGVLTREVFGLEVTNSGFHKLVANIARRPGITYAGVDHHFRGQLGVEAQALARSLVAGRGNG